VKLREKVIVLSVAKAIEYHQSNASYHPPLNYSEQCQNLSNYIGEMVYGGLAEKNCTGLIGCYGR